MIEPIVSKDPRRFVFIDALRGVAALAVVMFHALTVSPLSGAISAGLPASVNQVITDYGSRGVQIFFVISGFVIAHSLRQTRMNLAGAWQFILRRQIRLDPPYWVMIAATLLLNELRRAAHTADAADRPDLVTLVSNLLYVHRLIGRPDILGVGWTLAVEIQFYLTFMLILAVSRRMGASRIAIGLLLVTGIGAIACDPNATYTARWGGHAWPYFVAGVFVYWAFRRQASAIYLLLILAAMAGSTWQFGVQSPVVTGIVTATAIYGVGRVGRLQTLWGNRQIQFFGRISYSLYLTHVPVVVLTLQIAFKLTHGNRAAAVGWYVLSILSAIAVAYPFHRCVELPSMKLATRFKRDPGPIAANGFGEELPGAAGQKSGGL